MEISAPRSALLRIMMLALVWLFIACQEQNTYVQPPPPKVTIAQPLQRTVIDYLEFTGTTHAVEKVDIRARVSGFLQSMHFTPGTMVKKGDLLFVIEPTEYKARLNAAQAELDSAASTLKRAETEYARVNSLFQQKAAAEKDVVKWRQEQEMAKAGIALAETQVERAQLDLSYTRVTAPIDGRVSRNFVDVGNLVGEGEPTLLTTVTKYDPIYAYFNLNERDLLDVMTIYKEKVAEKGIDPAVDSHKEAGIPLHLGLGNEKGYPHAGVVDFAESGVDPKTGTLQLRGVFPNPGSVKALLPGLFVRIRMPVDRKENALLVTERATGADQGGRYLLVVNSKNTVEKRSVRMGQHLDGLCVIEEGLRPDEWVIVNGIQHARSGATVDPERFDMNRLSTSARIDTKETEPEKPAAPEKNALDTAPQEKTSKP